VVSTYKLVVFCRLSKNQSTRLCFHLFAMIQTCAYLYSSNFSIKNLRLFPCFFHLWSWRGWQHNIFNRQIVKGFCWFTYQSMISSMLLERMFLSTTFAIWNHLLSAIITCDLVFCKRTHENRVNRNRACSCSELIQGFRTSTAWANSFAEKIFKLFLVWIQASGNRNVSFELLTAIVRE